MKAVVECVEGLGGRWCAKVAGTSQYIPDNNKQLCVNQGDLGAAEIQPFEHQ